MKKIKIIPPLVALTILSLLVIASTVSAEPLNAPEGMIIAHYPDKYDWVGTIYRIGEREVVIDDMFVPFSSQVIFMTPQSAYATLDSFKPGQQVGYVLNDENQISKLCLFSVSGEDRSDN